ncbi:hypothetical protein B0O99DRAFT_70060 [Bisporella sp. PMI_857]|nr:hypothetical protein B0O99DRAFT_70060 [Bisporella sp. PMI_857]
MASPKPPSAFRKSWYKWKSLHLPWRKRFLVGLDLHGNTFWEFRDQLNSHRHRMRRIAEYPSGTHYSEVNISPQWHQWLKHVRQEPPSIQEQTMDVIRQRNLKVLAAQADARWEAKGSFLEKPKQARVSLPGDLERGEIGEQDVAVSNKMGGVAAKNSNATRQQVGEASGAKRPEVVKQADDPWKQARRGPSEEWQPQSWDGNLTAVKR